MKLLSVKAHAIIGAVVGLALILAPWLFGFSDLEGNAWVPLVVVGIMVAGYALVTRTDDAEDSVIA